MRQTKDRFAVGEVTRTDVAQAEAALAGGQSQVSLAESNLKTSIAAYRRDIGDEPKQLAPGRSIEKFLPKTLELAVATSQAEHPAINATMHGVDSAELQVKVAEGALVSDARRLRQPDEALRHADPRRHSAPPPR